MKKTIIFLMVLTMLFSVGCAPAEQANQTENQSKTITLDEAVKMVAEDDAIRFIDVRTQQEYDAGHVASAELLPLDQLESKIESEVADKDTKIIVYCRSGNRSGQAQAILNGIGYNNVYDAGGIINYTGEVVK